MIIGILDYNIHPSRDMDFLDYTFRELQVTFGCQLFIYHLDSVINWAIKLGHRQTFELLCLNMTLIYNRDIGVKIQANFRPSKVIT